MHSQTLGFSAGQKGKNWAEKTQSQIMFWNIVQSAFFSKDSFWSLLMMLKLSFWFIQLHHCTFHIITILSWTILQCWTMGFFQIQWRSLFASEFVVQCSSAFSMLTCIHILSSAPIPVRSSSSLNNSQSVVSDWKMKFQPIDSFFFLCSSVISRKKTRLEELRGWRHYYFSWSLDL